MRAQKPTFPTPEACARYITAFMESGGTWDRAVIRKREREWLGVESTVYEVAITSTPAPQAPGPLPET